MGAQISWKKLEERRLGKNQLLLSVIKNARKLEEFLEVDTLRKCTLTYFSKVESSHNSNDLVDFVRRNPQNNKKATKAFQQSFSSMTRGPWQRIEQVKKGLVASCQNCEEHVGVDLFPFFNFLTLSAFMVRALHIHHFMHQFVFYIRYHYGGGEVDCKVFVFEGQVL